MTRVSELRIVEIHHQDEAVQIFKKIGVDPYGIGAMLSKTMHLNILISSLPCKMANILKQEMLSLGADAAVARGSVACSIETTDVLLMGTIKQMNALMKKIEKQPFGLDKLSGKLSELLNNKCDRRYILKTSRRDIVLGEKTLVMGILNVTPDSFSDGSHYFDRKKAVERARQMAQEGADMIDIGGESSRPGAKPVTTRQEVARVLPIVEALSGKLKIPISVDTTKAIVAQKTLEAGAEIINDISALKADRKMALVVRQARAGLVLMHMRGMPESMQKGKLDYEDLMGEISDYLANACRKAVEAGIERERLVVDPGIGFGKSYEDNCSIIKKIGELKVLGLPILIGASRKAFIGNVTGGAPTERMEGTAAVVAASILNGCHIVRVHDVAVMKKVAAMTDAICKA